MKDQKEHPYVPKLKQQLAERKIDRREFLRTSTLLGVSAVAAYEFAGRIEGRSLLPKAAAAEMPKGGHLRMGYRVPELDSPHTFAWGGSNYTRCTAEHLTRTGADNVTRPWLCESWEATEDLKTWHLHMRKGVKWRNGRPFGADDAIWNLQHVLDIDTGSSVLGLMKGYMMNEEGTGLWDANAIEKVDDHTVRLNCRNAQLAVPEHLFHYPLHMLDPEEGGVFGVGANGTGAFEVVEAAIGQKVIIKNTNPHWWGEPVHLDSMEFLDLGDDPTAPVNALISKQVLGVQELDVSHLDLLANNPARPGLRCGYRPYRSGAHAGDRRALHGSADTQGVSACHRLRQDHGARHSGTGRQGGTSSRMPHSSGIRGVARDDAGSRGGEKAARRGWFP